MLKVTTGMPAFSTRSITGASAPLETEEIASPSILPISVSISLIWLSALAPTGPMNWALTLSAVGAAFGRRP